MDITGLLLSRLQFAFTVSFHIIFPSFTIATAIPGTSNVFIEFATYASRSGGGAPGVTAVCAHIEIPKLSMANNLKKARGMRCFPIVCLDRLRRRD